MKRMWQRVIQNGCQAVVSLHHGEMYAIENNDALRTRFKEWRIAFVDRWQRGYVRSDLLQTPSQKITLVDIKLSI